MLHGLGNRTDETHHLAMGWNLISFDISLNNYNGGDPATVFADLINNDNLIVVTGYDNGALMYDPSLPPFLNSLTTITQAKGYWVKVNSAQTLSTSGTVVPDEYLFSLRPSWNLIGYYFGYEMPPSIAFADLINNDNLIVATGYDNGALIYNPNFPPFLNSLTEIVNSQGYWVKLNNYQDFIYPQNYARRRGIGGTRGPVSGNYRSPALKPPISAQGQCSQNPTEMCPPPSPAMSSAEWYSSCCEELGIR